MQTGEQIMTAAARRRRPPSGKGLTYEKVWNMFQETDRKFQENREQLKETDRIVRENAERQKETDRQMKETDRAMKEAAEQHKETERIVKEVAEQMGGLHRSFGELAEHLVAPGIVARFNELGFHFDSIATKGAKIYDEQGNTRAEIDLLLENGEYLVVIEVKSKPREKDVEHHIRRLEIFREYREKINLKRKRMLGAIAGAVFGPAEKKVFIEAGFYVLEQSGDTMKMDIPSDFVPREW
jgi:hypothetical protein